MRDDTADKILNYKNLKLIRHNKRGRAIQMNRGAWETTNDYLLFLHADTIIDKTGFDKLKYEIINNQVSWGWFSIRLNSPRFIYRILETLASYRTMLAHEPLGDHGNICKERTF